MHSQEATAASEITEVFPYLHVPDAPAAIEFYRRAFGARELFRLTEPGGKVGHAELAFGRFKVMLCEEYPELGAVGPASRGGPGLTLHLHVRDADALAARAVVAGATMVREPENHFYGERSCTIRDPFGYVWMLGHEIEKVTPDEMQRRYAAMFE